MGRYIESKTRTLVKTILLRIIVFSIITFSTVFIFQQDIMNGIEFGLLDIVIEMLSYFFYDRVWMKIEWGVTIEEDIKKEVHNDIEFLDEGI